MSRPDRRVAVNTLLLLAVLGAVVAVVLWMIDGDAVPVPEGAGEPGSTELAEPEVPVAFGPFALDEERLHAEWRRERADLEDLELGDDDTALMREFHRVNARSFDPALTESQREALNEHFVVTVGSYVRGQGPRRYRALGWVLAEEFESALAEVGARARETGRPVGELMAGDDARAQRWRERLGNFYEVAETTGLVDAEGRLTAEPELAVVLFRYRWFAFAEDYANLALMTPAERAALWRWRIEVARGLPLQQRLAMVADVEADYREMGLDPDAARGILYYQEEHFDEARSHFARARRSQPDDPRYAAWEREAAERAERAD